MSGGEGGRPYRLGIDVGSNSLGWFVVWLNGEGLPVGLGPGGVRIYSDGRDPQSKTSNAVQRRVARGARRRRDRYLKRRAKLMTLLIQHGLMPGEETARKELEKLDPYELRAKALDEALPLHHLGRALFHLDQRRGFLSNRKIEKGDKEAGVIKEAAGKLATRMAEEHARTLGEFLYRRHRGREPVRARNRGTGAKAEYDFYPTRQMVREEFSAIWATQAAHHPALTSEAHEAISHAIFDQRPLKPPPVGKCSLDPARDKDDAEGFRCPWAHPLAQRLRIWQEVRNLKIVESGKRTIKLTKEQGDKIALALFQNSKMSFNKIRAQLNLPSEAKFNLESQKRLELIGDETAAKLSGKSFFGKAWRSFPLQRQIDIVGRLVEEQDEPRLIKWLVAEAGLERDAAARVVSANIPDSHCRLGLRAIKKILPFMESGMNYPDAAKAAGYDHAQLPTGEQSRTGYLPYYGEWLQDDVLGSGDERDKNDRRWGRFPNPTVHIGLGQLRRVVNALIREYGPPAEIAVEMTRDFKLSPKQLEELEKEHAENQRRNEARRRIIREHGQAETARNILKLRLWEELSQDGLDRICPYTGERISVARLLSAEVDIDHLIPFSDSWDDSAANKIVCMTSANRLKGTRTPFEAFGTSPAWPEIAARAANLPKGKRWRFGPDARDRFDASGGFLARQLNETGWLARSAKTYLSAVTDPYKINVLPGKLTALIRGKWGLNDLLPDHNYSDAKNRKDHRHHAIDAMVAAMTDRSLLHRMASTYDDERERIEVPKPWESLRDDLKAQLDAMIVSHKADHGLTTQLFKDTAYGRVRDPNREQENNRRYMKRAAPDLSPRKKRETPPNLVLRKDFRSLNANEIDRIRDIRLRTLVRRHVEDTGAKTALEIKAALQSFADRRDIPGLPNGIRHVRLVDTKEPDYLVPIANRKTGEAYKSHFAGKNAFVEIFETGKGRWEAEAMSVFAANQDSASLTWRAKYPDARFVMRVFKGDMLRIEHEDATKIVRVVRLSPSNNVLYLVKHNEAGNLEARHDDKNDPFRWIFANIDKLREWRAELVRVDELGRVWHVPSAALRSSARA